MMLSGKLDLKNICNYSQSHKFFLL